LQQGGGGLFRRFVLFLPSAALFAVHDGSAIVPKSLPLPRRRLAMRARHEGLTPRLLSKSEARINQPEAV